jgi:hypothetical protein
MGEKIIVGPVSKGMRNDRTPFMIDDDSFPSLINAYQWRGRVKRKRGTSLLGRLNRTLTDAAGSNIGDGINFTFTDNIFTLLGLSSEQPNASVIPITFTIEIGTGPTAVFQDTVGDGILTAISGTAVSGTINYASGSITLTFNAPLSSSPTFISLDYYPGLPVMGLEDFVSNNTQFPGTIAFDTIYSYNILTVFPYTIYDVSFYKNPPNSAALPGYIQKSIDTPTTWNGANYQQFWTTNYLGSMWATNGISTPFITSSIGMQFMSIAAITITAAGPPAIVELTIAASGLVIGDFVFINEVLGLEGINFQTGYVTQVAGSIVTVEFPYAIVTGSYTSGGIAQYLTNRANPNVDCLRWYDGDPTSSSNGWVNFAPPLSQGIYSIAELPAAQYYLVGARIIVPFKDRLLFMGPVVQTSGSGAQPIYLQDSIIYSQNGTPYYTVSFNGNIFNPNTPPGFFPMLVPTNQTASPSAFWADQTGFGGQTSAGIDQPLLTASPNEDVLILGFATIQTRLIYSGNDIIPFVFYITNSELGSGSTFSAVTMDEGVITRGTRGYIITSQVQSQRIDLDIPDEVFEVGLLNNGNERFCSQRDFINEWIYFTYPSTSSINIFPSTTLQYNYRDNSWAIFYESYTTYGTFRKATGFTWATVGLVYPTWAQWNEPWNAGISTLLQPEVIGGNQHGFVLIRDQGTGEGNSLYIQNIVSSVVTAPDHCLNVGDYIQISGCIGTVANQVNGQIFSVAMTTENTFNLNPPLSSGLTYLGGGVIKRFYIPFIQSKQFPVAWQFARKTRLGPQQYLLTTTSESQITLLIYLSQAGETPYNSNIIVPDPNSPNNTLIYSTVLYTCPESTNLGLTPANVNLNMVTANAQQQTWHRVNTSLLGDTVQIALTMSDSQMRSLDPQGATYAITGATNANPCVLTTNAMFSPGQLIQITGVVGMTQLNYNLNGNFNYYVISSNSTSVTIQVDSTNFGVYISGGSAIAVDPIDQTAEIELHAFILDVSPSQLLA